MAKKTAEEKQQEREEKLQVREESLMQNYTNDEGKMQEGCKLLGKDAKNFYLYNPYNEILMQEASRQSQIEIEVPSWSEIFPMDCWYAKPKNFVCQLKKIAGKDLANPLLKNKRLLLLINGDVFYSMSPERKKYHLLKELTRILYDTEKDKLKILKYEYQNNNVVMDTFGANPTEQELKEKFQ